MKKKLFLMLIILGIFLTGCFDSKKDLKNNTDSNGIEAAVVYGDNVVTDRNLAGEEEVLFVDGKVEGDLLITDNDFDLKIGNIVLVNESMDENAVAKEITAVIDSKKYNVKDAAIEDVFKNLDINKEVLLVENNLEKSSLPKGVNLVESSSYRSMNGVSVDGSGLSYIIEDYVLYGSGENEVKVNASVFLKTPKVNFDFRWSSKYLELTLETGDNAFVQFDGDIKQGVEGEIDLGTYNIPLSAWGVPLGNIEMALSMAVRADGQVKFLAKATQDVDIKVGVQGEMFSGLGFVNDIKVPESAKDYFSFGMNSNGGVEIGAGISPSISYTLLQYKIVGIRGEIGVEARSIHELEGSAETSNGDVEALYKAYVNPYLYIDFTLIGVEGTNRIDILKDKNYEYEVSYSTLN